MEFSNHDLQLSRDQNVFEKKNTHTLHDIMSACIIMHNMIIEDERDAHTDIENWREALALKLRWW